ncbi:MAG: hypothetical protein M4579_000634 [Chaenotheca gracillima]|nr:MAG: hypothetical protein M4579_000634 [Chaenotheca gracillima]
MAQVDVLSSWNEDARESPKIPPTHARSAGHPRDPPEPMTANALPRAASFTHLPTTPSAAASEQAERFSLERSLSDIFNPSAPSLESSPDVTPRGTPKRGNSPVRTWAGRRKSGLVPQITISKFAPNAVRHLGGDTSYKGNSASRATKGKDSTSKHRTISDSFANFARRPWTAASRSPSPSSRDGEDSGRDDNISTAPSSTSSTSPRKSSILTENMEPSAIAKSRPPPSSQNPARKGTLLLRKSRKSAPAQSDEDDMLSLHSSRHSTLLPKSFSTDRLPSLGKTFARKDISSSRALPTEQQSFRSFEPLRKKDELWGVFRGLESDYHKFDSKPSALKVNVVRSSLLPFLRNYARHSSNQILRPEDLDRRTIILDKWWTGLLGMLDGANKTIAGTDRPAVLEGITGIMTRPEWRLPPSLSPQSGAQTVRNVFKSKSSTSLDSNQSEFWVESVHHNVRNLFIQNLQTQMAIVVNTMSLRSAPASLVTWSGKAIAYAFYFCPGVADALVRLWGIPPDALRRAVESLKESKSEANDLICVDEITGKFPSNLHSLRFAPFASMVRTLRRRTQLPLGLRNVQWDGPWTARWCGRDSDLLFVFIKHWHILLEDFVSPEADLSQKVSAPAFVMVHAQILIVLDSTIHRQLTPTNPGTSSQPSPTFDDVLEAPDSSAPALPLPASNITRLMAENRLVMLLRDFLSENSSDFQNARHTFAEAFTCLLRAAAQKTSIFNHNACSTLCDFMEEALFIFARFQRAEPSSKTFIDWAFWVDACKEMAKSQSTATETRLFTFLYSIWSIISSDKELKEHVCLDWLLTESTFNNYFAHWCPMVRALFVRLLCWRVARCDQLESELDRSILQALSDRLHSVWLQFQHLMEKSESQTLKVISIAPCNPVPGRRLMIVRNDTQTVPGNVFFSFDGAFPQNISPQGRSKPKQPPPLPHRATEDSNIPTGTEFRPKEPLSDVDSNRKKRWSLFRNTKPFTDPVDEVPSTPSNGSPKETRPQEKHTRGSNPPKQQDNSSSPVHGHNKQRNVEPPPKQAAEYTHHSFKFSLELIDRPYGLGKERRLYPPRLPFPAQTLMPPVHESRFGDTLSGDATAPLNLRSTYVGRALAEWAIVVGECHGFFDRRKSEGIPSNALVETPMLGIDSFRGR